MKNIHLFETKEAYETVKNGLILPTLSYIEDTKVVDYNPTFDANGHDYVEISGIKWATMNVGAKSVTDYGLYFQWGDTQGYTANQVGTGEGKKKFAGNLSDYKWYDISKKSFTKYNKTDNKTVLDLDDDAVHAAWGGSWRMPTIDEFITLRDAVKTEWKNKNGVYGLLCTPTAQTDTTKTLFFPACGNAGTGNMWNVGSHGNYWSSSLNSDNKSNAYEFYSRSDSVRWLSNYERCNGFSIRGVLDEK